MNDIQSGIYSSSIRKPIGIVLFIILGILFAACGGGEPAPPTQLPAVTEQAVEPAPTELPPTPVPFVDLDQVYDLLWVLVGFGDAVDPTVVERDTVITLVFAGDGTVSGSSGCNN